MYAIVGFKTWEAPSQFLPSPSVWADGLGSEAQFEGTGYSVIADFKKNIPDGLTFGSNLAVGSTYDANYDSVLQVSTGSTNTTSTAAAVLYVRPLGIPALTSQNKLKFEAIVAPISGFVTSTTGASAFVGVGNLAAMGSLVNTSTTLYTAGGQSIVGFYQHGDNQSTFDCVYQNSTGALSTVLANALNSSAFTPGALQPQLLGAGTGTGTQPPSTYPVLSTSTFLKLAVAYDGVQYWTWYVNGIQVAKLSAIGTTDNVSSYGPLLVFAAQQSTKPATWDVAYVRGSFSPAA